MERWRRPPQYLAIEDDPEVDHGVGRPTQGLRMRLHPETVARIKLGYMCLACQEPHEQPFPNHCSLCGYPMKANQMSDFARAFGGKERDPRSVRLEKEQDRVDDTHERRFHTTKTGIIVPGKE